LRIHTTKYSGGHENFVKMIKNACSGWQIFSKMLTGKDLNSIHYHQI